MLLKGLEDFAERLVAENDLDVVFIAIMPINDGELESFHLEVEQDEGAIAGVWDTRCPLSDLATARKHADRLHDHLEHRGVRVIGSREEWEAYLDSRVEE